MKRYTLYTLVLLTLVLLSVPALAQQGHGPVGQLSPEKQAAVATLRTEHQQAILQDQLQLRAKQAELDALLAAPQPDQAKIAAVSNEITALHGKMLNVQNTYRRKIFDETGFLSRGGMGGNGSRAASGRKGMAPHARMQNYHGTPAPQASQSQ